MGFPTYAGLRWPSPARSSAGAGDVTTTWWRKDRDPAKLFVDYNQNARDHTIASAYSVRGKPEGTVSTPITLGRDRRGRPADFTIATVPARFAELGDLHAGIDDAVFSSSRCWSGPSGIRRPPSTAAIARWREGHQPEQKQRARPPPGALQGGVAVK